MKQRAWLDLSRKLVDKTDMFFTLEGMTEALQKYAKTFFGEGVIINTDFPNPFVITPSGGNMTGTVSNGIAYDEFGNLVEIPATTLGNFIIPDSDLINPRWDLLVIRYKQTGDTPVPKPSDPILTINLNLHDDYELIVRPGIASATPAYPAKQVGDILLSGIVIPATSAQATSCTFDLTIREYGYADKVKYPHIKTEPLLGVVDGVNQVFTTSLIPMSNGSVLVSLDGVTQIQTSEYGIVSQTITFTNAPELAQIPYVWYIVMDSTSINPLAGAQEVPTGVIDGVNLTFGLVNKPANKDSMMIMIDGLQVDADTWSLVQNTLVDEIIFDIGKGPIAGQTLYTFMLVNPATVGVGNNTGAITSLANIGSGVGLFAGMSGPIAQLKSYVAGAGVTLTDNGNEILISAPSVSGGMSNVGTFAAPIILGAGVYTPPITQRQVIYMKSSGGSLAISLGAGTLLNQELIIRGTDNANILTIAEVGAGTSQNGSVDIDAGQAISYLWNGIVWDEISRRR